MNKIVIILLLCLCSPCFADHQDLSFHQPNLGNTELYYNDVHKDLKIELKMEHSYEKNDIFIFPCEFYGESEYYRLGFYVDMDKNIVNEDNASGYRILYKNYTEYQIQNGVYIPDPCTLFLLGLGGIMVFARRGRR